MSTTLPPRCPTCGEVCLSKLDDGTYACHRCRKNVLGEALPPSKEVAPRRPRPTLEGLPKLDCDTERSKSEWVEHFFRVVDRYVDLVRWLDDEIERLTRERASAIDRLLPLGEECERLRAALEFYAAPESWRGTANDAHDDRGAIAREALAGSQHETESEPEGYGGIAHDFEQCRQERDKLRAALEQGEKCSHWSDLPGGHMHGHAGDCAACIAREALADSLKKETGGKP